jgi:hypothetical protein
MVADIRTTPGLFTIAEGWVFARAEGGDICKVANTIICLPPRRDESELEADCTVRSYEDIHGGKAYRHSNYVLSKLYTALCIASPPRVF